MVFAMRVLVFASLLIVQIFGSPACTSSSEATKSNKSRQSYPSLRPEFEIILPEEEPFAEAGRIRVRGPDGVKLFQLEEASLWFKGISSKEEALELVLLSHWGALVDHDSTFNSIVEIYRERGFEPELGARPDTLAPVVMKSGDAYSISFTVFELDRGMGASAAIRRYRYDVEANGSIELKGMVTMLLGPALNWQTDVLSEEDLRENEMELERRMNLIREVYKVSPQLIPDRPR